MAFLEAISPKTKGNGGPGCGVSFSQEKAQSQGKEDDMPEVDGKHNSSPFLMVFTGTLLSHITVPLSCTSLLNLGPAIVSYM